MQRYGNNLTIIIPVYNEEESLKIFFPSIEFCKIKSFQLVVVNDGSTDNLKYYLSIMQRA